MIARGETPGGGRVPDAVEYGRAGGVCGRRRIWPGTCIRPVGGALYPCRPGFRPGLWSTGPTARPGTCIRYGHSAPFGSVWRAYAIRPYRGTCIRVPSGTRPNSPGRQGRLPSLPGTRPNFPASAEAVLIGISVRLHLAFASGFLSVCEGKGLYVRRACQYVILRISSPPCTWPECSFYRRPIYCLSAPYASRGVPEIHEP